LKLRSISKYDRSEEREAFVLILPLLLLLGVFIAYPVASNFYYGFTRWKGFGTPTWVGFANFTRMFKDQMFGQAMRNTFILVLYIPLGTLVPLIISAMLREGLKGWAVFKAVLYIPNVLGYVIVGMMFAVILRENGAVNEILRGLGLDALAIGWLTSSDSAIHVIGVLNGVWSRIGFGCIYFLAAMSSIDSELYDAAKIDGAGWWRTFFSVTVPSIRFAIEFWVVLQFITVFARMFGFIYTLTGGGPGFATTTLEFGIYIKGFSNFQMGYASAWAMVLFVFCAVIAAAQIYVLRRRN
jgi:ABC-type sugar transport system permease subunit